MTTATLSPPRKHTAKTPAVKRKAADAPKAFAHQTKSLVHAQTTPIVFDTSDPGTGKTYVRIKAYEARKDQGKCLVLAPKSLLKSTWLNDIKKFAPGLRAAVSVAGKHEKVFAEDVDVYITNLDAVNWLAKQNPKTFFKQFSELIVDESTAYKHHSSLRSKAAAKIAKHFQFKTCMTGTPNGRSITDVWHQVYLLDYGRRLGTSFYKFRETVCSAKQVGANANAIQWTDKDGAEEAVFGLLSDIVVRHKFEDCVDIPANHTYSLDYELAPKARKAYEEMEQQMMLNLYGEEEMDKVAKARIRGTKYIPQPKSTVTAINAGVVANKLLQISSGAVYGIGDKYHVIDTGRYEMILDLVEEAKHSLTFFFWRHQRDMMVQVAEKRGINYAVIDGSTPDEERNQIVERYQRGMYQTIFAHPKSAAHGLTLTRGTRTIWPCPTYDLELFKQGSKRQHRMGQTQKTETIVVVAEGTLEEKVYKILADKNARMNNLLDLFATL